ncbi:MAG TPA: hypothetical protein VG755_39685, partial [Nannocystaceae bacterium]|nr:hypothetical protein [Nannocystaceae bacterium]
MRRQRITIALWLSLSIACAVDAATPDEADRIAEDDEVADDEEEDAPAEAGMPAPAPARAMPKARAAFDEIATLVATRYVDGTIDE